MLSVLTLGTKRRKKESNRDFLGGPVVKYLPVDAGDTGSIPGLEKSHMLQRNSLCTTNSQTTKSLF